MLDNLAHPSWTEPESVTEFESDPPAEPQGETTWQAGDALDAEDAVLPRSRRAARAEHAVRAAQASNAGKTRTSAKDVSEKTRRKRASAQAITDLIEHDEKTGAVAMGAGSGFTPTFGASRHERQWIIDSLGGFYENSQITDVLAQVKGGKEATVYCCAAHPSLGVSCLAAKVYRPRMFRTLSNDAAYREGSGPVDEQGKALHKKREMRAIAKKTKVGQELLHGSWLFNEYRTMTTLYEAGVLVPKLYAFGNNAMLMEYLGEPGAPAPTLSEVRLDPDEARVLFDQLIDSVRRMLACNRVHADLSAYNVLYWEGQVRIIDFPQAVDPLYNPSAYTFFRRDVQRLCQYFARYRIHVDAVELANQLWASHMPGEGNDIQGELLARVNTHAPAHVHASVPQRT
jgi:RIO kinase 1